MDLHEVQDPEESYLVEIFRELNEHGRRMLLELAETEFIVARRDKPANNGEKPFKLV